MTISKRCFFTWLVPLLLCACAAPKYTVDDGRKVDEKLLGDIRTLGMGEQVLRPAIFRSSALKDPDCDKQWELPFSVNTSYNWSDDDKVAWVRGLGVDERLTVIGVDADAGVHLRDKLVAIAGYKSENADKMMAELADRRDAGKPFRIDLSSGKSVRVTPFEVCRGYTRLAPPNAPQSQDYHWLMSMHPLQVVMADMDADEALWTVLWTQGVSEEGGTRMKAYHYGTKVAGTLYNLFTIASGLSGAAAAANAAISAAQSAAAATASSVIKQQLLDQASAYATDRIRTEVINSVRTLTQAQAAAAMQQAAANRSSLSGVAWVAATVFDRADAWAYTHMEKLNANPLAGFSLHQKLIERGLTANSLVLDPDRMTALNKLATAQGKGDEVVALLGGIRPDDLRIEIADMPLASAPSGFSYEDTGDAGASNRPFAHGLIDGLLEMPVESAQSH